jgi:hypothetical protein
VQVAADASQDRVQVNIAAAVIKFSQDAASRQCRKNPHLIEQFGDLRGGVDAAKRDCKIAAFH